MVELDLSFTLNIIKRYKPIMTNKSITNSNNFEYLQPRKSLGDFLVGDIGDHKSFSWRNFCG